MITPEQLLTRMGLPFSPKSNRLEMLCPFHDDRNPSAAFYSDSSLFHCYTCDLTFGVTAFYAKFKGVTWTEAARETGEEKKERNDLPAPLRARLEAANQALTATAKTKDLALKDLAYHEERLERIRYVAEHGLTDPQKVDTALQIWYNRLREGTV